MFLLFQSTDMHRLKRGNPAVQFQQEAEAHKEHSAPPPMLHLKKKNL